MALLLITLIWCSCSNSSFKFKDTFLDRGCLVSVHEVRLFGGRGNVFAPVVEDECPLVVADRKVGVGLQAEAEDCGVFDSS